MNKNFDQEIQKMKNLINYGVNESVNNATGNQSTVEYHQLGADGKTYGIIRENSKFYIKSAPKKDTAILAEDYQYIGGFGAKKENEFSSYAQAYKHFEMKMKDLNESCNKKVVDNGVQPAEWQINETKEMRSELERMNQITRNVNGILSEGKNFTQEHTLPEAPATAPSPIKVSDPYTDTAVAKGDKEMKNGTTNYEKAGGPFSVGGTVTNADMQSDKKPSGKGEDTYNQKPKFGPKFDKDTVADKHPSGGKVTRADESRGRTVKLTEEQVLAWNRSNDNYMDKSHGTEIGDSAPFDDEVENPMNEAEGTVVHTTDNQNKPAPGVGEIGDSAPYDDEVNEGYIIEMEIDDEPDDDDSPEIGGSGNIMKDYNTRNAYGSKLDGDDTIGFESDPLMQYGMNDDDRAWANAGKDSILDDPTFGDLDGVSDVDDDLADVDYSPYDDPFYMESRRRGSRKVNEATTILDDFGKHPAYRKEVMTLPPNKEIDRFGRDWNDKSAKGSEPFGQKIGKSDPYTDVVEMLTDAVMSQLTSKKKD